MNKVYSYFDINKMLSAMQSVILTFSDVIEIDDYDAFKD